MQSLLDSFMDVVVIETLGQLSDPVEFADVLRWVTTPLRCRVCRLVRRVAEAGSPWQAQVQPLGPVVVVTCVRDLRAVERQHCDAYLGHETVRQVQTRARHRAIQVQLLM
jgi:hypothetical protein